MGRAVAMVSRQKAFLQQSDQRYSSIRVLLLLRAKVQPL